jgi:hypothetical protein
MARIATETCARDQVFIIAHPHSVGDPACTGCKWLYPDMLPGTAQLVEVWNGVWGGDSNNEPALAMWYDWLNQGLRIVATAGTDTHSPDYYDYKPGFNVVYAESLSEAALLQALRAGHLYLSAGPRLEFGARTSDGQAVMMGDVAAGGACLFALQWEDCPPAATVRVIADGQETMQWPAGERGNREWTLSVDQARWCVIEIRAADGAMLAVTNPVFLKP